MQIAGRAGGSVLHVGCGDAELTPAWRVYQRFVAQGLTGDLGQPRPARDRVRAAGLQEPASVDLFNGRTLPYADNLVSLLVLGPDVSVVERCCECWSRAGER